MGEQEGPGAGSEATDATPGTDTATDVGEPSPDQTVSGDAEDTSATTSGDDDTSGDDNKNKEGDDDTAGSDDTGGSGGSGAGGDEGGLDVEAERGRLDEVGKQIEEARRALADTEGELEPEPDGQPVAEGEGAPNAPPG